jgi:hypothetical protein
MPSTTAASRVGFRYDEIFNPTLSRRQRRRKRSAHGTHAAIERQLAEKHVRIKNLAEETSLATRRPQRHEQIEGGAFLVDIGRCEIDGDRVAGRKIEAAIAQSGADAFAAFFHCNVRQSDDREMALESRDDVHFRFDQISVHAEHGCAECLKKHPKML